MQLHTVRPPLPSSYVVFLPVLAGPYPGAVDEREAAERLDRLLREDVELFVDLTEPGEREPYAQLLPRSVRHVRFPLRRDAAPAAAVGAVLEALDRYAARDGMLTYVHDAHGVGRVGTVVGCWLASMGMGAGDPLSALALLRRRGGLTDASPAVEAQRALISGWPSGASYRHTSEVPMR